ncbi:MAG: hypothetical protein FOGNACKC_05219 [Anaerolineae bacterium]|nr:hypothetical protein [Anaerolineae bacterium]
MSHLQPFTQELYELRFSPQAKPVGEVSNLTQLESHTTRARIIMMWRAAHNMISWDPRSVELIYQSTLDSISEAFEIQHYAVSQYMLAARADIWEAGLAPEVVKKVVAGTEPLVTAAPEKHSDTLLLAGEVAQLEDDSALEPLEAALRLAGVAATTWNTSTGVLAYVLGAWDVARKRAEHVVGGLKAAGITTVIADGPETAWILTKAYPALGVELPAGMSVKLLSAVLADKLTGTLDDIGLGPVMVHDSRPACLIADAWPSNLAVMPGYLANEAEFGKGKVFEAPRRLVDALGGKRLFGTYTRALAKTSGADDGLWQTYPKLAQGLAAQRLDYALHLGAKTIVTDSPLAAAYLKSQLAGRKLKIRLLAELLG